MSPISRVACPTALLAVTLLGPLAGCNSKSDSGNPVANGGATGATVDDVSASATGALDFVTSFVSEIEPLTRADFSTVTLDLGGTPADAPGGPGWPIPHPAERLLRGIPPEEPEVRWVEEQQAWVLDTRQTETSVDGTATVTLHFAVQYLTAAGAPQQLPDEATATMTLDVSMDLDFLSQSEGEVFDLSLGYDLGMTVGGLPHGPYPLDGGGSLDMSLSWTGPSVEDVYFVLAMDWLMDVTVPADGSCPQGLVTMNIGTNETSSFSFVGSYDGTPAYGWTLYEAGVTVDSGSGLMDCSPAL